MYTTPTLIILHRNHVTAPVLCILRSHYVYYAKIMYTTPTLCTLRKHYV